MRIALVSKLLVLVAVILLSSLLCLDGAPVGSKTYIVHMTKNATHLDVDAKHAWYTELMDGAKAFLAADHPDDGMDSLHHVYHHVFHGFSARLTAEQVAYMQSLPCVMALYPDRVHKPQTTHSSEFVGLSGENAHLWPESNYGADSIIGVIDTGIWPERLSFSDHGLGPIPKRWKGSCQAGTNFTAANCNKKIIGAKYFYKGYEAENGKIVDGVDENGNENILSARDSAGHGTHCASTAAGRWARRASYKGLARGTAVGMAPKARIAVYKALWEPNGGMTSDLVAAFDQAVADGVNVISYSVGSDVGPEGIPDFFEGAPQADVVAAFNAVKKGVFVSVAGGNEGPAPGSIANTAPWYTTVAATTQDREEQQNVLLGNGEILVGRFGYAASKTELRQVTNAPLLYGGHAAVNGLSAENASFCQAEALDASLLAGKILVCNDDQTSRFSSNPGAAGIIFVQTPNWGESLSVNDGFDFPFTQLGSDARLPILAYIASNSKPTATILPAKTVYGITPAPKVAGFSNRGPIRYARGQWLKPDIAAPGVDILAAGIKNNQYAFMSGTSMACPHVSGFGALLHSRHPKWSPAAIRSALMTTATTLDNTNHTITAQETSSPASPWDFGAGFAQPEKAMNPGLVYDMGRDDYLHFLCGLRYTSTEIELIDRDGFDCPSNPPARIEDTNFPSFVASFGDPDALSLVDTSVSFFRTLTNVGSAGGTYKATVDVQPKGFHISFEPSTLKFSKPGSKKSFVMTVTPRGAATLPEVKLGSVFLGSGSVSWSDGEHVVRSPVVVTVGEVSGLSAN
ncbi:hypothetical protein KC19_12G016500 [Ceratodon purpureus]|uniref:Subtilisin-like protease n=1 Tax=Ceratodon purpureus TaxID=3225 RepID=A0A8T0G2N4_CERPU|nr:hypothetical protein KC19_12G016500 [Ceratodon purpureus]